jgi:hypothetical protein
MVLHIDASAALAPISAASTIIGFISFAFTLGTFLRVFWGNIMTIMNARREIPVRDSIKHGKLPVDAV